MFTEHFCLLHNDLTHLKLGRIKLYAYMTAVVNTPNGQSCACDNASMYLSSHFISVILFLTPFSSPFTNE